MAERFLVDKGPEFTPNVTFQQNVTLDKNLAIEGIPNVSQSIADVQANSRPGGDEGEIQFKKNNIFAGSNKLIFDEVNDNLVIIGDVVAKTGSFDLIDGGSF
jgi:hypothetical protein